LGGHRNIFQLKNLASKKKCKQNNGIKRRANKNFVSLAFIFFFDLSMESKSKRRKSSQTKNRRKEQGFY
jgi:hypothetical protein